MSANGSTRRWRQLRADVIKAEPVCWLRLPGCTIRSTTADHIIPLGLRPDLRYVRANLRGACASCNYRRGNTPINQLAQLRASLSRAGVPFGTAARQRKPRALAFFG